MRYFYDTEFLEGKQDKRFLGIKYGETKPTIDLISIGIVSENGREYYAISKDFDLKEAWNRYDLDYGFGDRRNLPPRKIYWIRENVLKPIYKEFWLKENTYPAGFEKYNSFCFSEMKRLINKYGKTIKDIEKDVLQFSSGGRISNEHPNGRANPKFYGYYSAYDHVVLCWLFGKMLNLPDGFPMYTRDLKQILDEKLENTQLPLVGLNPQPNVDLESKIREVKAYPNYPKQTNEHNALEDARWNKKLFEFIRVL